jgi:general stress protein 26
MLGEASRDSLLPMTPYIREHDDSVYFFTRMDTTIAQSAGAETRLVFVSKDQDYHAYVRGKLARMMNNDIRDEFWSPTLAAWYEGKDDPAMVIMQFHPQSADVWASTDNPLRFGFEIAKANMSKHDIPDVGGHAEVRF